MLQRLRKLLGPRRRAEDATKLKGQAAMSEGRYSEAASYFREALRHDRNNSELRLLCGDALSMAGDTDSAELEYRLATDLSADSAAPLLALGGLLLDMQRPAEALPLLRQAVKMIPGSREIECRVALAAFRVFDFAQALDAYLPLYRDGILDIHERNNLGICLLNTGKLGLAQEVLAAALAEADINSPVNALIARNLAYCLLTAGNWREGFRLHERRFQVARADAAGNEGKVDWLDFIESALADIPPWKEGRCEGKRLLVWMEQGLGDVVMLARFLPVLLTEWRAMEVTFLCPEFRAGAVSVGDEVRVLAVTPDWKPVEGYYDAHCSIMSLPYLMGITPESIPGTVPYYLVDEMRRSHWRERTDVLPGLRVGLAWSGNPLLPLDKLRSVSLATLAPLFSVAGISFLSLQKEVAARNELCVHAPSVADWMDDCHDLRDTAALICNLDLVISVDTAVAHLAGALGKPVWLLNRYESEWRWMRGREDTPWYPTMRIFNQTEPRNWESAVGRMADELEAVVARGATQCGTLPC